jgi:multidrug transporter EmrE-like cation transporter
VSGVAAAFGATALYYIGFAVFKVAADRMDPLRGSRPLHMALHILANWIFLVGLCLVLGGLSLQIVALSKIPLSEAVPIFVSGLVPLIVISVTLFAERLTLREWASLLLIAAAMLLLALSIGAPPPIKAAHVEGWKLAAAVAPALLIPFALISFGDHRPDGRHARPVAGIAYGLSAGLPVGTAELAIKGWGDSPHTGLSILHTPYPYVTVLSAALGFGILQAGFQRSRVIIVATVMTIAAKTYLLLVGSLLYGEPWPEDTGRVALRVLGFAVAATAVLLFPRHDPAEVTVDRRTLIRP